jgi:prophage regulatory protein
MANPESLSAFVREHQLLEAIPISHTTLWRLVSEDRFPQPIKISPGVKVWFRDDILQWVAEQRQEGIQ